MGKAELRNRLAEKAKKRKTEVGEAGSKLTEPATAITMSPGRRTALAPHSGAEGVGCVQDLIGCRSTIESASDMSLAVPHDAYVSLICLPCHSDRKLLF